MRIRMTRTENGSIDGIHVQPYFAGKVYDLTGTPGERNLASAFVGARMAVEVKDEPKAILAAPEVQAIRAAPENKRGGRGKRQ